MKKTWRCCRGALVCGVGWHGCMARTDGVGAAKQLNLHGVSPLSSAPADPPRATGYIMPLNQSAAVGAPIRWDPFGPNELPSALGLPVGAYVTQAAPGFTATVPAPDHCSTSSQYPAVPPATGPVCATPVGYGAAGPSAAGPSAAGPYVGPYSAQTLLSARLHDIPATRVLLKKFLIAW